MSRRMSQNVPSIASVDQQSSIGTQRPVGVVSFSEDTPDLFVTDLHRRTTGVSATIRTLIPYIAAKMPLDVVSSRTKDHQAPISLWKALRRCWAKPRHRQFRIWHVRRNNEMLWGLIFKHVFRCPLTLVMTSCALRRHSWLPRLLLARMDSIIATSEQAAGYFPKVDAIIPHGVDCKRFHPPTSSKRELMRSVGLPAAHGIAICGRIRPEKGTDLFVEALIQLLPKHPKFIACIAGRAAPEHQSFQQSLQKKISDAGLTDRFFWLGEVAYDQMPDFLAGMSLCVAPARYEGFGLVPLEAMASGVPVVASRTGCYPDAILSGKTGALFDCGDLNGLVTALSPLLASPNTLVQMSAASRNQVVANYSAEAEANQIMAVYQSMWSRAA